MLSACSVKILRHMNRFPDWEYQRKLEQEIPNLDSYSLSVLVHGRYVDMVVFDDEVPDYDGDGQTTYPAQYRISDAGRAYLEGVSSRKLADFRSWVAIAIALLAMLISAVALVKSW